METFMETFACIVGILGLSLAIVAFIGLFCLLFEINLFDMVTDLKDTVSDKLEDYREKVLKSKRYPIELKVAREGGKGYNLYYRRKPFCLPFLLWFDKEVYEWDKHGVYKSGKEVYDVINKFDYPYKTEEECFKITKEY